MLLDEVPGEAAGEENIEIAFRPPVIGRILSERFLIEEDLSDPALAGRYSSHRVKDLKELCRNAVLNIVNFTPVIESGPSFQQVCEALAQVSHPNVQEVIETGVLFDGRPYSLTEPPNGELLKSFIGDGKRLELEDAASIIEQAAEGLSAVHRKGILHCDLRPSNLVISDETRRFGVLTILHIGAAWPVDVRGDGFVHLPADSECFVYAAPETFAKLGHRSAASDVYSLAVIAYRLLTGRLPFEGSSPAELLERASRGECIPPTELRTDLTIESENLLLSGLRFEPAWRPQDVEDFGSRLVSSIRAVPTVSSLRVQTPPQAEPAEILPLIEAAEVLPSSVDPVERPVVVRAQRRLAPIISDRAVAWVLIILLLAGALSIPIAQTLLKEEKAEAAVGTMLDRTPEDRSKRQLRFWIESRSADKPISISEAASSTLADAQMSLVADSAGEIYVIGESKDADGRVVYKLLSQLAGNEVIPPGKAVRTAPIDLNTNRAFWIVWTGKRFQDLDSNLMNAVAEKPIEGSIRTLRHFLERNRNLRLEISDRGSETVLNGVGDKMVYRLALPQN